MTSSGLRRYVPALNMQGLVSVQPWGSSSYEREDEDEDEDDVASAVEEWSCLEPL